MYSPLAVFSENSPDATNPATGNDQSRSRDTTVRKFIECLSPWPAISWTPEICGLLRIDHWSHYHNSQAILRRQVHVYMMEFLITNGSYGIRTLPERIGCISTVCPLELSHLIAVYVWNGNIRAFCGLVYLESIFLSFPAINILSDDHFSGLHQGIGINLKSDIDEFHPGLSLILSRYSLHSKAIANLGCDCGFCWERPQIIYVFGR
jgi:hypothetical protein